MKKSDYINRKRPRKVKKLIILRRENYMDVITFVKNRTLEKDRKNLEKTQRAVLRHLEYGDPLVPKFEEKIRKFAQRYDMTRAEVLASIMSDRVAATTFAKTASRQRIAEKSQFDYLREIRGLDVDRLKASGPESMRLRNGNLETGTMKTPTSTKSIDGKYKNDYIFIKWTDGAGGTQDYAGVDAFRFLEQATKYTEKHDDNTRFVAILDGPYFTRHWELFASYRTDRVLVETSDTYRKPGRRPVVISVNPVRAYKARTA